LYFRTSIFRKNTRINSKIICTIFSLPVIRKKTCTHRLLQIYQQIVTRLLRSRYQDVFALLVPSCRDKSEMSFIRVVKGAGFYFYFPVQIVSKSYCSNVNLSSQSLSCLNRKFLRNPCCFFTNIPGDEILLSQPRNRKILATIQPIDFTPRKLRYHLVTRLMVVTELLLRFNKTETGYELVVINLLTTCYVQICIGLVARIVASLLALYYQPYHNMTTTCWSLVSNWIQALRTHLFGKLEYFYSCTRTFCCCWTVL
jgi:hypothetical protein